MKFYYTVSADYVAPYMLDVPVLLPASSWARVGMTTPRLPSHVTDTAADSGGFVATKIWGDYRYSPAEYVAWLEGWRPGWAATMDYCCEDEITTGNVGLVRERQDRTTEMAYRFFDDYQDAPWQWVPTIQGWTVEDYRRHARQIKPLLAQMRRHYSDDWRVGIGTLCARASNDMIRQVVNAVNEELPDYNLHLWGVKLGALKMAHVLPRVVSVDSAAWHIPSSPGWGMNEARDERKRLGMTKREYEWTIELPRYRAKVADALNGNKQYPLVFNAD